MLTFDTQAPPWNGDLGAFLRDRLTPGLKHARSSWSARDNHRFTPVRLPDGLYLEIRVEPLAASEPPSWSPEPGATGPALIELHGGALVMSNVILRHDDAPASRTSDLMSRTGTSFCLDASSRRRRGRRLHGRSDRVPFAVHPALFRTTPTGQCSRLTSIVLFAALTSRS